MELAVATAFEVRDEIREVATAGLGPDWHARHTDRSRKARNAQRQLEALGYDVIITLRDDAFYNL
jgi:hypothetical protein